MKLATLCYVERDGCTLMLRRTKKKTDMHKGLWVGLGGKFEAAESPEDCAAREVREECGLEVTDLRLRGIITFPEDFNGEDWYVFVFSARSPSGELSACDEGELEWIENDRLLQLKMHEGDYHFIRWMREDEGVFSAKLEYDGEKLLRITKHSYSGKEELT